MRKKAMFKILVLMSVFLLLSVGASTANAVDVNLACPTTVNAGSSLTVTVYLTNWDPAPVTVSRFMMGIVGNSGGTLGGAGIWGPYNRPLSTPRNLSAGGGTTSFPLQIISSVPAGLQGTMAMVVVNAITSYGAEQGSGSCLVAVQ